MATRGLRPVRESVHRLCRARRAPTAPEAAALDVVPRGWRWPRSRSCSSLRGASGWSSTRAARSSPPSRSSTSSSGWLADQIEQVRRAAAVTPQDQRQSKYSRWMLRGLTPASRSPRVMSRSIALGPAQEHREPLRLGVGVGEDPLHGEPPVDLRVDEVGVHVLPAVGDLEQLVGERRRPAAERVVEVRPGRAEGARRERASSSGTAPHRLRRRSRPGPWCPSRG